MSIDQEAINTASCNLAIALSLLDMLETRWQEHSDSLVAVFGGAKHTDEHALAAIERLVISAKEAINGPPGDAC